MTRTRSFLAAALACGGALLAACASTTTQAPAAQQPTALPPATTVTVQKSAVGKEQPPAPGPQPQVRFPKIERSQSSTGLELDTVELHQLPVVRVELVIRSGSAADPDKLPGLAHLTATMLKEGTHKRSSAKLAEAVDFLGAHLDVDNDTDRVFVSMTALAEHFDQALEILAEVVTKPAFDQKELDALKKRELARLELQSQSPRFLANREFNKAIYGAHPYAHIDTNADVVKRVKRDDLAWWHQRHFAPNNAFLVVAGDVTPDQVKRGVEHAFAGWAKRNVPPLEYPLPPAAEARKVILVDRPRSVQSVIYVGNLALARSAPDFVPLLVANQVLGGSAASRLFMDLREKRSLTYGAYSDVDERVQIAPFSAFAAVRNEVTGAAMSAFEEHLQRIVQQPATPEEMQNAKHYLIDRFPLRIETADKIASLVADLRTYDLPDDYWDTFGKNIDQVTAEQALAAAQKYIKPNQDTIVVVGEATVTKPALEAYGPITVVDTDGKLVVKSDAAPAAQTSAAQAPAAHAPSAAPAAPAASTPPAVTPAATATPSAGGNPAGATAAPSAGTAHYEER